MMNVFCPTEKTKVSLFSEEERSVIKNLTLPKHVAIIPDGNRRWASKHLYSIEKGHKTGADVFITTLRAAKEMGIQALTVFGFSTENWERPRNEVVALMKIFEHYITKYTNELIKEDIRFSWIGNTEKLPPSLQKVLTRVKEATRFGKSFDLVVALNYGGRDEICRAIKQIVHDTATKKIQPTDITEALINQYLDTAHLPDPDLIIRTSGEKRVSNFLLWQNAYSELYLEETPWPNFTPTHLLEAVIAYTKRDRRKGGCSSHA